MSEENGQDTAKGSRPSVLSLNIKERSALYAAYMPHLKRGGIFIPTTRPYRIGDEVFLLLSIPQEPNKIPVAGQVVWVTPANNQGNKIAGVGVQFSDDESGLAARRRIEAMLGGLLESSKATHTY
jgi:type IV pilus assembly protein PilZ